MTTKGIPSVPDVPVNIKEEDLYRILEPLKRIIDIRQGRFDPLDRWVTQQDLIDAGLQNQATVEAPVVVVPPVSVYNFILSGDVTGGPTQMADGTNPITMATAINLPNLVCIDGGNAGSTYTPAPSGPYGVAGGGQPITVQDEGLSLTTSVSLFNFVGAGVVATNVGDQVTVTIAGGGGGTPAGADTQVQFNDTGSFGASADFTFDGDELSLGAHMVVTGAHDLVIPAGRTLYLDGSLTGNTYIWENTADSMQLVAGNNIGIEITTSDVKTLDLLITATSAAVAGAGIRIPHGTAPTSPVNGDVWSTSSGFFGRTNGVTKQLDLEGRWTLLETNTVSGSPTFLDFTWDESLYKEVMVVFEGIQCANNAITLQASVGEANGATMHEATGDYTGNEIEWTGTTFTTAARTDCLRIARNTSNTAGETCSGVIHVSGLGTDGCAVYSRCNYYLNGGTLNVLESRGFPDISAAPTAIDTLRLFFGVPTTKQTIANVGSVRLYGLER